MTKEEAEQKICPMRSTPSDVGYCLSSNCMMWRRETLNTSGKTPEYSIKGGYCGLAGKP